ncbi:hypothetical protein Taro_012182 [Colocasia esculenta]|uniref:Uncharacterized protein n=1 Tax=Colocasia esculenta TaxID=4460 RepID=A0A843UIB4_COLES|nr:hypothetical protein [Colocasia esculenta]
MAERKSSTTGPENEGKDMTNMGQTEEGRGSSTSPAPMDVDELEKVVQMASNVGTLNREEDKEEYEIFAVNEEENLETTISIKHGQAQKQTSWYKSQCGSARHKPLARFYTIYSPTAEQKFFLEKKDQTES